MTGSFFPQLVALFHEVLPKLDIPITPETAFTDIPGWDSLARINFVLAVEKEFSIRFSAKEISQIRRVCDLLEMIDQKGMAMGIQQKH